jgi:hypothetical protein
MLNSLPEAIAFQSRACAALGANFSARLLELAGADIAASGNIAQLLRGWSDVPAPQLIRDAVALRLLASMHYLVLSGQAPELANCYPPVACDPDRAWAAAKAVLMARAEQVVPMLAQEPQTNEVGRSAILLGGFLTIAGKTSLPLRCFELGASAGLNSQWDKFRYEIGDEGWGPRDSSVVLACRWEGRVPNLETKITVVERQACDRRPVDLRQAAEGIRLLSYCWAEQRERMERLRAAVALAQAQPIEVLDQPASTWVGKARPKSGTATVVFHSIVWQYMPPAEQAAIHATLKAHASQASREAPFFWLRMELNEDVRQFQLTLRAWDKDEDQLLAVVHPHGEFASWC